MTNAQKYAVDANRVYTAERVWANMGIKSSAGEKAIAVEIEDYKTIVVDTHGRELARVAIEVPEATGDDHHDREHMGLHIWAAMVKAARTAKGAL